MISGTDVSAMLGMDPGQAQGYAGRMDDGAFAVRELVGQITAMVGDVSWFGANAERFRDDWQGLLRPQLAALIDALDANANQLRRHAANQWQVSDTGAYA